MFDVRELTKSRPGFLYEPRVLWGMGVITKAYDGGSGARRVAVTLPDNLSYLNGSRWPIVLTDVITLVQSPVGYAQTGDSIINQLPIELSSLGGARFSLGQIRGMVQPRASAESLEGVSPLDYDPAPLNPFASGVPPTPVDAPQTLRSVTNLCRWDFDHTLKLPPASFLEMQLSGRVPTVINTSGVPVKADVNFYSAAPEEGAQWPGSTITRTNFAIGQLDVPTAQFYYQAAFNASEGEGGGLPYSTLPFQGFNGGPLSQLYPPSQVFTARQAVQQKATFNLPNNLRGFSVGFDQNALDVALEPNGTGPLSTTTYVRCRSRNGGTQNYWWRDGAPLAIVSPSMTPAIVSKLNRPLAVQPGEGFKLTLPPNFNPDDLEFSYSGNVTLGQNTIQFAQAVFYISFTGYAVVEA